MVSKNASCVPVILQHLVRPRWVEVMRTPGAKPALAVEVAKARLEKAKAEKERMLKLGKEILDTLVLYGNGVEVEIPEKFTLGKVNGWLKEFSQTHKQETVHCGKLTKANLKEMWPKWKTALQTVGRRG